MKSLNLQNERHQRLETAFKDWLELTGYAETSIYNLPNCLREFLHYLEEKQIHLEKLTPEATHGYFTHLQSRTKKSRAGTLSTNYLYKHLQAIKRFSRYLAATGQGGFDTGITLPKQPATPKNILTREEAEALYEVCGSCPLGIRDRAMLAVFYGCGLRRSEGVGLDVSDYQKETLYVRKGKNYKERYASLATGVKEELENYLYHARPLLLKNLSEPAFFISAVKGERLQGQSLYIRLKNLLEKAGIEKEITLHSLRHSIATHLLQSGMQLENIARFLGHSTLESTQIYTHIVNEC